MSLFYRLYQTQPGFLRHGYLAKLLAYFPHMVTKYAVKQFLEGMFAAAWCDKAADIAGLLVAYPLKLASIRMLFDMAFNDTLKYSSITEYFAVTLRDGGIGLLFTGCLLDISASLLEYLLSKKIDATFKQQKTSFVDQWFKLTALHVCMEFLLFPAKVIGYNMLLQAVLSKELYSGILDCGAKMYAAGGVAALYSGVGFSLALIPLLVLVMVAGDRYGPKDKTE
ncbi:hypothetical protein EV183_005088 [Coemansia sp. RSA 2336]|nr:hypothetical protein EV183_005088 [Coemansia sp. RSA 2336]